MEDNEFKENSNTVLTVKTIRKFNKEIKRGRLTDNEIDVRSHNFCKDFDQIAAWLGAIEREPWGQPRSQGLSSYCSLALAPGGSKMRDPGNEVAWGHFQRTPRKNKTPRDGGASANDHKNSEQNACKSSKNKGKVDDKRGFLKLPQINDKFNCAISSRNF